MPIFHTSEVPGGSRDSISSSCASSGDNTIISGTSGKSIYVYAYAFSVNNVTTALTVKVTDGASGTEKWRFVFQTPANVSAGANLSIKPTEKLFVLTAGNALVINLSAAVTLNYSLSYWVE